MNRRLSMMLLLFGLSLAVILLGRSVWASEKPWLTLEKALEMAERNNPLISASGERIAQARARLDRASAASLPQLGVSLLYQEVQNEPRYPVVPAGYAKAGFESTWKAALTLNWLLYSGGAVRLNTESKRIALFGVEAREKRTRQTVLWGVAAAWYDLRRAEGKLTVAEDVFALTKEHLQHVEALFRNGMTAKNEVLRVQVSVSEAELNLIRAENAVAVEWKALERAVGVPLCGAFDLPPREESPELFSMPQDAVSVGLAHRPEMEALDLAARSASLASQAANAQGGPQVALVGEVYAADDEFFPQKQNDWKVTLLASWSFFDGGASSARAREARAAAEEFLFRMEDMKRQIELEISVARLNCESSLQRISTGRTMVESAEEDYRMALRRYTAQVGTNIDVLDARVALSNARNQLVESVYDSLKARAEMEYAMGVIGSDGRGEERTK
ncbi:MAG TPA: TolC family protein [Synergistales bacterium]|nr:TolC family protein [Synergistales bacterium]